MIRQILAKASVQGRALTLALLLSLIQIGPAHGSCLTALEEALALTQRRNLPAPFIYEGHAKKLLDFDVDATVERYKNDPEGLRKFLTELKEQNIDLAKRLSRAQLNRITQLYNREGYEEIAPLIFEYAKQNGIELSMLSIDANKFKQINDRLSHSRGDVHLKNLGELMALIVSNTRAGDTVFHIGGDEFLIVLQNANYSEANLVANRLKKAANESPFIASLALEILETTLLTHPLAQENIKELEKSLGPNWRTRVESREIGTLGIGVAQRLSDQTHDEVKVAADHALETQKTRRALEH